MTDQVVAPGYLTAQQIIDVAENHGATGHHFVFTFPTAAARAAFNAEMRNLSPDYKE